MSAVTDTSVPRRAARETRLWIVGGVFVVLALVLVGLLTFVSIPPGNKLMMDSVISVLLGGSGVSVYTMLTKDDSQLNEMRRELVVVQSRCDTLQMEYQTLKAAYDDIVGQLVGRIEFGPRREQR